MQPGNGFPQMPEQPNTAPDNSGAAAPNPWPAQAAPVAVYNPNDASSTAAPAQPMQPQAAAPMQPGMMPVETPPAYPQQPMPTGQAQPQAPTAPQQAVPAEFSTQQQQPALGQQTFPAQASAPSPAIADDPSMAMPSLPDLPPNMAPVNEPVQAPQNIAAPAPVVDTVQPAYTPQSEPPNTPPVFPTTPAPEQASAAPTAPPNIPGLPSFPEPVEEQTLKVAGLDDEPATLEPASAISTMGLKGATTMQLQGKKLRIGEVLMDMGLIDQGQLDHALRIQKETGQRLGKVLIGEGLVSSTDIARALSRRLSIEYVDLLEMPIDEATLGLIPFDTCTRYDVVPIGEQSGSLLVAMADPTNVFALDDLRLVTGRDVRVVVASPEAIDIVVSRMISLDEAVDSAVGAADDWDDKHIPLEDIKNSDAEAPAVNLVNQIITQAVVTGASDLHFEPRAEDMVVRFRKDGVLHHVTNVPMKLRAGVTSRLKIMASLDISERRKPQDGRVGLRVGDKPIDLRVASLPTVYGEKIVLRVLDKTNVMLDMSDLGFLPHQLDRLRQCYTQPYGCLLVTGPTGSGKSTTLYGACNEINDVERNIITVEDPVEYRLRGINQVQINTKAGLTFPAALRSILRSDPDVVMIGEMRDHETAHIGMEASLTGHLVLSTLHTNDAPGAVTRLTEMGIEPYLVTSSVLGVLAQRLARRLCKCAEEYTPERSYLEEMGFPQWALDKFDAEPFQLRKAVGCERCGKKGFKGRLGLHEVLLMSEKIAELAIARSSSEVIGRAAVEEGMITLFEDGVHKIIMGQTTMEELQRIVQH